MIVTTCDKCGAKLKRKGGLPMETKSFATLIATDGFYFEGKYPIHLCEKCEEKLFNWLYIQSQNVKAVPVTDTVDDLPF